VLGGAGISVGLLTYGYNVIKAIGMKLIKVTPTRGFAIEIGAFLVVIIGTNLGIPLSTTHCKVGATVAVGMCESGGTKNVIFLEFTCTSTDKLDHMMNTQCQPMCPDGYVPNRVLKCNLDGENEVGGTGPDAGGFILKTEYSGFTGCVLRELHDFPSTAGTCSR